MKAVNRVRDRIGKYPLEAYKSYEYIKGYKQALTDVDIEYIEYTLRRTDNNEDETNMEDELSMALDELSMALDELSMALERVQKTKRKGTEN